MANRQFSNNDYFLIKKKVTLWCTVSVGAAGAVTLQKRQYSSGGASSLGSSSSLVAAPTTGTPGYAVGTGQGVYSVVRTSTGAWTVTLSDQYQYLVGVSIAGTTNSTGLNTAFNVGVKTSGTNVAAFTAPGIGGTIALVFSGSGGTAADPANGDVITLQIDLGDETEP